MIKNTEYKQKILGYQKKQTLKFRTGIIINALFLSLSQNITVNATENFEENIEECYSIESDHYFEDLMRNKNIEEYDTKLLDIIDNGILTYNNQEYELRTLQIKQLEDGSNHVTCYLQPTIDIFSDEDIGYSWEQISQFGNSTIFYQMYKEGIINSKEIKAERETFQKYIIEWDGKEHDKTPFLKAKTELKKLKVKNK